MKKIEIKRLSDKFVVEDNEHQLALSNVWLLPYEIHSIDNLLCNNVLPYLTSMEADLAMLSWSDLLVKGGVLQITVPNVDYFIQLWQQATWDNTSLINAESLARKAFAGLWGEQSNGNPRDDNYHPNFQNVYKSGYNQARLKLLFERAGFCEMEIDEQQDILSINAVKAMHRGERQVTTHYDQIRPDHLNRYEFACKTLGELSNKHQILDLACGIGYGSLMLAKKTGANVTGVDIDAAAIVHAKQHFANAQTQFICQDAKLLSLKEQSRDTIVSFETIEHVDFDSELLTTFYRLLKPGGQLICSTPNQDVMPFDKDKFKFHIKHYTNAEMVKLLENVGFNKIKLYAQKGYEDGEVELGNDGHFTIIVCEKLSMPIEKR
jgi:2-polyprenyl-3-methyl-5-hydroxy-6-metoxy-1,4-benzoquinol methylase